MFKAKPFTILILVILFLVATGTVAVANKPLAGVKVVVDAGHGGWDPGAVGVNGLTEKQVNLQVAKALRNCLIEYGGADVIMTRTDDSYVSLAARVQKANASWADRFISIHHNGSVNPAHNGTSVYSAKTGSAASHDLRNKVQKRLLQMTGLRDLGANTANFYVLRNTRMPAILTEASFITNPKEEEKLRDPGYLWREAYYIYQGLVDHMGKQ
ncbi:N-acetylmuramoyl-L-alanine amidase family protein [Capillibacterium thermochitinicola]|uniref:N-acetylmuramoyl-L-alanine amidase n=1 Tax=Capillibacterium thermochitinicola TaxID=2699427 RepID=A0A8J6I061_9FIRM|nr:N-acetylmuramoyl-L-alanine amidase [Capillibacterium thermochitinicola]MBA2132838.1 N-acetylmuramoyl-L-alanine amidase [Capillibacterium thermochitinicola]